MGANLVTPGQAREFGRIAALIGRPIFGNPHLGVDADAWREGYLSVPESERGSRPDLAIDLKVRRRKGARS